MSNLCAHDARTAARVGRDTIASVMECDDCGDARPFTDADYAFGNAYVWHPRTPEGVQPFTWMLMSRDAQRAYLLGN